MNKRPGKTPFGGKSTIGRWIWIPLAILVAVWYASVFQGAFSGPPKIAYSEFFAEVEAGRVQEVTISGERIEGTFEEQGDRQSKDFITYIPAQGDDELLPTLRAQSVEVRVEPASDLSIGTLLINLLPILLIVGIFFMLFRSMRSQGQNFLRMKQSQAKKAEKEEVDTRFEDVAGLQSAKRELTEVVEFLKDPARFQRLGGVIPKGMLLVGPPGTGKTLLARAVAGEAHVPFFNITGSDFMEMLVGVGASRVRNLFKKAKQNAPSIIFIDELDSIGRRRGAGLGGGHDEREQTLNQLLSEMDGFEQNQSVVVMAATNRPDILDRALLRPGRFDRRIMVDMPTASERREILKIHAQDKKLADDVDLERVAKATPGFSGADLGNLLNEAALLAARQEKEAVDTEAVEQAKDKVLMGLTREGLTLTDDERSMLAYHEAGHAVVGSAYLDPSTIHKVTIVPRGRSMGVTQQFPDGDRYIYKKEYLLNKLAMMLGGRVAEEMVFDSVSTGAQDDLKKATGLARKMVLEWGMTEKFRYVAFGEEKEQVFLGEDIAQSKQYSESTAREIDQEIHSILEKAREMAGKALEDGRDRLDQLAEVLLEDEEVSGSRLRELLSD